MLSFGHFAKINISLDRLVKTRGFQKNDTRGRGASPINPDFLGSSISRVCPTFFFVTIIFRLSSTAVTHGNIFKVYVLTVRGNPSFYKNEANMFSMIPFFSSPKQ